MNRKKRLNKQWVAGIGMLAVIIILVGWWYYLSHNRTNLSATDATTGTTTQTVMNPNARTTATPASQASQKSSSVVKVAESLSGASQFIALFKSTGVADSLVGKGPFTIFVPNNGAFRQLPSGTLSNMTNAQKLRFIEYHVIIGRAIDSQAQVSGTMQAFSGDMLNFSDGTNNIPMVNSAIFIEKHIASNGVVYLIDNVLLPPLKVTR